MPTQRRSSLTFFGTDISNNGFMLFGSGLMQL